MGPRVTLIETAGGLYTPLSNQQRNVDLLQAFPDCHWVLIARNRLGVLHDVIVTLEAAGSRGCPPSAVLINSLDPDCPPHTCEELQRLGVQNVFDTSETALKAWLAGSNLLGSPRDFRGFHHTTSV